MKSLKAAISTVFSGTFIFPLANLTGLGYSLYMNNQNYLNIERVNHSSLVTFLRSPAHYKAEYIDKQITRPKTQAMIFGEALHCRILEPNEFDNRFIAFAEDVDKRTKEGKKYFEETLATGKQILSYKDRDTIENMYESFLFNPLCSKLFEPVTTTEKVILFEDKQTQLPCKAKLDAYQHGRIIDLKTTLDASPKSFESSVINYNYDTQAAFYIMATEQLEAPPTQEFVFIAMEKQPPYAICVYRTHVDSEIIQNAKQKLKTALANLKQCKETNTWPGYSNEIIELTLPAWVKLHDETFL